MKYWYIKIALLVSIATLSYSCSKDNGAQKMLNKARESYNNKDYKTATMLIDSIGKQYPKAFTEIKAGIALLDSVRRGENEVQIKLCDSLLAINNENLESLKKDFVYKKDKEYDDIGVYYPKETYTNNFPGSNMLRSGVNEKGELFIESIFLGSKKHDQLIVALKDGEKAETLPETSDGLNYSFQHAGSAYETIRFVEMTDNGVARFVSDNADKAITAQLKGKNSDLYTLSNNMKTGINNSYKLKLLINKGDSLTSEKEKSIFKLEYLDGKKTNNQ